MNEGNDLAAASPASSIPRARAMTKVPVTVGDNPAASVAGTPPPVDPGSDSDSDQDNYFLDEPQFVLHAVDDDRRNPPAPAPVLLPIQHRPAPEQAYYCEADRLERVGLLLILPQAVLCFWNVALGVMMICAANNPETQTNLVWVVVCSALVMLFSLVSMLLSLLAVYYYDGWP